MPERNDGQGQDLPGVSALARSALDGLEEGFMVVDRDDRVQLWNRAFLQMLELPEHLFAQGAEVLPLIKVLAERGDYGPGDPDALVAQIAANIRNRKTARGEREMTNGNVIEAEWLLAPDDCFMFRLRNVTGERNASRFKDELIATISHELRTPLTAIIGALGLLRGGTAGALEAKAAQLIEVAFQNGERLEQLVDDMLEIARLQSEGTDFGIKPTDLRRLLRSSVTDKVTSP